MYIHMYELSVHRAYLICQVNKNSQECKVAWDVMKSRKRRHPPPKKPTPVDKDLELSQRE